MSTRRALSADAQLIRRTAFRAGLQSALAVALTVVVLCGVAVLVLFRSQHSQQSSLLDSTIARADDVSDPPADMWLVIQRGAQRSVSPGLPDGLPDERALAATAVDGATRAEDVHAGPREYRVSTQRRGDEVVQGILDLRSAHEERDRMLQALLVTGLVGLLLAGTAGAWLGRRSVQPLAHALSLQRRFVADAGHELRTPLTLLSTRAQLLQRRAGDAAFKSDLDELVTDARQLTGILEDLLLAADPREQAPGHRVDLGALAQRAVAAVQPAAAERGVRLTVTTDGQAWVHGSEAALRRALNALLDNGIRHARSTLTLSVETSRRDVVVEVADDGPGIDPAVMPNLFTRFSPGRDEQHPPSGRRRYGLGLSLVSEIAARHGGSVSAGDAADGGAVLHLKLPR